jgi:hypothetical protein
MVEDSLVKKFSGSSVSVAGVNVLISNDADISAYINATHITFPIAKNGDSIGNFYSAGNYSIVVIDKDGILQFVQQLTEMPDDKTVSDAASKVRRLLANGIIRPQATTAITGRKSSSLPRYYTLSGRTIAHPIPSVGSSIVLCIFDGRVTGAVRFAKPNP